MQPQDFAKLPRLRLPLRIGRNDAKIIVERNAGRILQGS